MKVYIAVTPEGKPSFHAESHELSADAHPHHAGVRGWLETEAHALKTAWDESSNGVARALHTVWDKLQRRIPADEPMLIRLRRVPSIELQHPQELTADAVESLWKDYLARRQRRHLPWLGFNAVMAPLSVVLAPLPGPNVIGYWFVYRTVRHLLALLGLRRARCGAIETTFHSVHPADQALPGPAGVGKTENAPAVAVSTDR